MIGRINNAAFTDRLIKAGPAAAALEFGIAAEKGVAAYRAIVGADLLGFLQRTAPWPLGTLHPGYFIYIPRQDLFPLFLGQIDLRTVGMRIDRVVGMPCCFFCIHGN